MSARPTPRQDEYVRSLQRTLRLTNAVLDAHCVARFGRVCARLDRGQLADLIEELKARTETNGKPAETAEWASLFSMAPATGPARNRTR